jgi:hypothetical protein
MSRGAAAQAWRLCRGWLLPALADATEAEIVADLAAGRVQLWPGAGAAMLTQLVDGPEPFVLVWLGGGDLDELLAMRAGVEAWARAQGAQAARINGRRGWRRVLAAHGFAPCGDELRKAL